MATGDANSGEAVKFLYSYGGRIVPRRTDGKLCYVGGHTRVISVHRSVSFSELMGRFGELCGSSIKLKCKLPNEDLDVLVSITCDEELAGIIDEYARFSSWARKDLKIKAVLFPVESLKNISAPISIVSPRIASPPSTTIGCFRSHSPTFARFAARGWKLRKSFVPNQEHNIHVTTCFEKGTWNKL